MAITGYIGNTDHTWYEFLASRPDLREINFWQPSGGRGFHAISPGEPFFFRLKAPHNAIAGFGYLARHEILPAWLAWDTFGVANGAATYEEMISRIARYRRTAPDPHGSYKVGCLMIIDPVFFPPNSWVRQPAGWHQNIVQGKTLDLSSGEGLRISIECNDRAKGSGLPYGVEENPERFGEPLLVRPRLGQGSFRIAVASAYQNACAVTTEHSLPVLDAAHIQPFADGGKHEIPNGILLRSDIHRLFDKGYVTIGEDFKFLVSKKLKEDYSNGRAYYALHGQAIHLPARLDQRPSLSSIKWHNAKWVNF